MRVSFLELELTGRCQLACAHCYADAGPTADHGTMSIDDWRTVIGDAATLGIRGVQFIGGEPTMHPGFPQLLEHAIQTGLKVEVFTNLAHVDPHCWSLYQHPSVSLATSYYSDLAAEHDKVTGRRGSHARTRANIAQAVARQIPIRAGIIGVLDRQRVQQARADLAALGVQRIRIDRRRAVGRAAFPNGQPSVTELCGRCGRGRAAISPHGDLSPCVLSRWLIAGNLRQQRLGEILAGPRWQQLVTLIPRRAPSACNPDSDGDDCAPAETDACAPAYD
jgi:MoaA/NifB/PqqE/SkfB family radical SAM enzyme